MKKAEWRLPQGDLVEPRCPDCGGRVVYNGNYFCIESGCRWGFPHADPDSGKPNNSALCALGVAMYRSLMERRGEEPDPRALELNHWRW